MCVVVVVVVVVVVGEGGTILTITHRYLLPAACSLSLTDCSMGTLSSHAAYWGVRQGCDGMGRCYSQLRSAASAVQPAWTDPAQCSQPLPATPSLPSLLCTVWTAPAPLFQRSSQPHNASCGSNRCNIEVSLPLRAVVGGRWWTVVGRGGKW